MKLFLIFLVFELAVADKLDRTYLPPPGASYAGGTPGDIQAPLEPPNKLQSTSNHIDSSQHEEYTPTGYSTVAPVTTTSYAFTQTTTFPSIESYETTATLIDPITGLEVQSFGKPMYRDYTANQPDYNQNQNQNFVGNNNSEFISPTSLPDSQYIKTSKPISTNTQTQNKYRYPNVIGTETAPNISGSKYAAQGLQLNPQNGLLPNQQFNLIGSQTPFGQSSQSIYSDQRNNLKEPSQYTPNQDYFNKINPEAATGQNNLQPIQQLNNVGSSTPATFASSTLSYPSDFSINRPERPQANADRNAIIINYENVLTPTGYYYSYDTSNGIHADESGSVEDGTRAQGSYSYIGDDGKVYSVIYTADENGFQPRGDHLPTPPPIPEAIKEVIEQAARDKEAGIVDDGSYDEEKYGYKKYQQPMYKKRLQIQRLNNLNNDIRQPIAGIAENDYNKNDVPYQFNNNISQDKNLLPNKIQSSKTQLNKINNEKDNGIHQQNQRVLEDDKDKTTFTELKYGKNPNTYYDDQQKNIKAQYFGQQPEISGLPNNKASELYNDENSSIQGTKPTQRISEKGTTRRPFLTPEVYNQLPFNQAENNRPSATQEPFTTPRVTIPKGSLNNDYDESEDRNSNLSNDNRDINFTKGSDENFDIATNQPYEFTQTTSKPQYKQFNERSRSKNKETATPNYNDNIISSTSRPLVPPSKFDSNINKQIILDDQYQPNYYTNIGKQTPSQNFPTSYKSMYYKPTSTTEPISDQPDNTYTYNRIAPVYGTRLQPGQNYQTSTYRPSPSEMSSTVPAFQDRFNPVISSETYQQSLPATYDTKNHYEPIKSEYFNTVTSKLPNSAISGTNSFQTPDLGYVYGPPGSSSTIQTTPNYFISSTNPNGEILGYSTTEGPVYPSTGGTYDQNFVNDFTQPINLVPGYSYNDQEPIRNQGTLIGNGQKIEKPGAQGSRNDFPQTVQSPSYTKYYDQPKIIGENFIGPKQPQGFNPETGYHY